MKSILLISHSQKLGGAERCLIELAEGLVGKFKITVVLPSSGENHAYFTKIVDKIVVIPYPWWVSDSKQFLRIKLRKCLSQIFAVIKFIKLIYSVKPDYVISNTATVPSAAIACFFLNIRHSWFIHELIEEDHGFFWDFGFKISSKVIDKTSDLIFVNSGFVREKYERFIKSDRFVIVNLAVAKPSLKNSTSKCNDEDENLINLYIIDQIQQGKGQLIAVKAHELLQKIGIKSRLNIIGSISNLRYYQSLCDYILENKVDNIVFEQFKDRPFENIKKNAIGLVCSKSEAFGRITIEYMKAGIPIVGSNSGNTPYIIKDKWNGVLFEYGDPQDLVQKIHLLISDKKLCTQIKENAESYANKFFNNEYFISSFYRRLNS